VRNFKNNLVFFDQQRLVKKYLKTHEV